MALLPKPTESDLRQLIENEVPESQTIDYKLSLSVNTDDEKKEFLADIVAFANTVGGHLIIGMKEDKGLPIDLPGVQINDPDKERLRLEDIIREGISQRVPSVSIHSIKLNNGNWAIVIYIPKSLSAPHMVSFKRSSRFYARHSSGKYQLDIPQIRQAFLLAESIEQKIRDFRLDRVAKIAVGDTPIFLDNHPKIAVHFIPLSAYQVSQVFDISNIHEEFQRQSEWPLLGSSRFNLDGVLFYTDYQDNQIPEYLQIFRNGNFEYVNADIMKPLTRGNKETITDIRSDYFEKQLMKKTESLLSFQKAIGIEPPIYIFMSLMGVKGIKLRTTDHIAQMYHEHVSIDRDVLLIPEVLFEIYPSDLQDVARSLKPAFDAVWNAAGWAGSRNYKEDGSYKFKEEN